MPAKDLAKFQERINQELLHHRVITNNEFTHWFEKGEATPGQVKAFIVQFSVFSNLFLIAQLKKMIHADSLEGMRASKEILANELGVIFNNAKKKAVHVTDKDMEGDPELVSTEGSIEGGVFHFRAAHFEWLLKICDLVGLKFQDVGKRRHGTESTLFFCDELARLYGHEDYKVSTAASYAIENWAARGFWKQLIQGLQAYKKKYCPNLPLAFFTWHDRIEDQHARHTQEELEAYFLKHPDLNQDDFIRYGNEMMEGIWTFWDGLNQTRKAIE
ncbi:MAG: hypothetical protein A3B70_01900 [Deltaproteobacteria bacterium RIFCSPHIGHO2_02_FULL_40_11]|nr:MAG: hypothetical protein A3B70_01900 [Deltaproteobacteria bacterium RIFCSPHIGHO2_02_FULL_40_11]